MEWLFVIVLEANQQKVKAFNLDSASVYNAGNLATALLWVLRVVSSSTNECRWFPVFVRVHNVKVPAATQLWILSLVLRQSETLEMNTDFCPIKTPRHFSPHNIVFKVNLTLAMEFSHALRYQLFVSNGHGRFLTDVWFRHIHKVPDAPAEPKQRSLGKVSPYLLSYTDIGLSITKPFKTKSNQ